MIELWLKFQDANGETRRILVAPEKFTVGRHSENDLTVADGKLSRDHLKIDRFGDVFIVSDCGSSNGTTLNGENLTEPVALKNEDRLNLGGGLEIAVEMLSDDPNAGASDDFSADAAANNAATSAESAPAAIGSSPSIDDSISTGIFWLIPIFGVLILIFAGGLLFVFSGGEKKERPKNDGGFVYSTQREAAAEKTPEIGETPTPRPTSTAQSSTVNSSSTATFETPDAPTVSPVPSEVENVARNAASFMRSIAFNDPKPFLTSDQIAAVSSKISQFKGSAALAENLKAIKKNAAQFAALASSKNLKPQFLAVAALTKLGNTRGDPLVVAQTMLPTLTELKGTLDNKLADDNLLIIAGYERSQSGKNAPLQNVIEGLSKSSQTENIAPREIRTIWFLKKKDKISDAEYNFALQFLAIGIISQNPKDFNVAAEPIVF